MPPSAEKHTTTPSDLTLYGGRDPRDLPRYTSREVARAVDIPPSTVGAWIRGYVYRRKAGKAFFKPVIELPDSSDTRLSFNNLLEISVLRALRRVHEVNLEHIRKARAVAQEKYGVARLLISPELRAGAGQLFLARYSELIDLSPSLQLSLQGVLEESLERVNFESAQFFPIERVPKNTGRKLILVSPFVAFGKPILESVGVSTRAIFDRATSGEPRGDITRDYGIPDDEFEEAIRYESAAA